MRISRSGAPSINALPQVGPIVEAVRPKVPLFRLGGACKGDALTGWAACGTDWRTQNAS